MFIQQEMLLIIWKSTCCTHIIEDNNANLISPSMCVYVELVGQCCGNAEHGHELHDTFLAINVEISLYLPNLVLEITIRKCVRLHFND